MEAEEWYTTEKGRGHSALFNQRMCNLCSLGVLSKSIFQPLRHRATEEKVGSDLLLRAFLYLMSKRDCKKNTDSFSLMCTKLKT